MARVAVAPVPVVHSSGRQRWSAAAATPSGSTASRVQQPRHRNAAGVGMRRSEARGLGAAHACRRRARAEEVTSRSVAEEPTMFSSRESENGSPGYAWEAAGQTTQCGRATQHAAHARSLLCCSSACQSSAALASARTQGWPPYFRRACRATITQPCIWYPCAACQCEIPGTRQGTRTRSRTARQVHSALVFDRAWH